MTKREALKAWLVEFASRQANQPEVQDEWVDDLLDLLASYAKEEARGLLGKATAWLGKLVRR